MFENLSKKLSFILNKIRSKGRLTKENITDALREIRKTLLEADVSLSVIKTFINSVLKKSIGQKININLTPGQEFIKIIKNELIEIMGKKNDELNFSVQPPAIFFLVGLQGTGKTTTVGKLAKFIKKKYKKKILITSLDIYRPAAIQQLHTLSKEINVDFFFTSIDEKPIDIARKSLEYAKKNFYEVLLIDTAGRLHIDKEMMNEIIQIKETISPIETLLVLDAMTGQEGMNISKTFNDLLSISGIIITKIDGDSRGGIALSARFSTKKPIKFIGTGEKLNDLQPFLPEKIAERILGMKNVISFIKNVEKKIIHSKKPLFNENIAKNPKFDLNDFYNQIDKIQKIDGVKSFIKNFPNKTNIPNVGNIQEINENTLLKMKNIINSMTKKEKKTPNIIKGSRKKRIANGSGTSVQDINKLLKQFEIMKRMIKKIKKNGIHNIWKNIKNYLIH
ncbi:signal recognition particle protein [Buchnera aphidicola (Mindarus keteleerifoliae)]|uniref:signal recognition particle protein n=1 Tax=Buchnera aphidicola TaxID=9 RepID=UPI0031B6D6E6